MKIKCRKCQNFFDETNEEEDIFCPYCGALIDSADQIVSETEAKDGQNPGRNL